MSAARHAALMCTSSLSQSRLVIATEAKRSLDGGAKRGRKRSRRGGGVRQTAGRLKSTGATRMKHFTFCCFTWMRDKFAPFNQPLAHVSLGTNLDHEKKHRLQSRDCTSAQKNSLASLLPDSCPFARFTDVIPAPVACVALHPAPLLRQSPQASKLIRLASTTE